MIAFDLTLFVFYVKSKALIWAALLYPYKTFYLPYKHRYLCSTNSTHWVLMVQRMAKQTKPISLWWNMNPYFTIFLF